ncbi:hypothetical protein NPIL_459731 [Nephila pilipes]|uniref:Uncharacterized protein n=1 Tax=Nephila pilipes TaxID=299642 RepID=A0A8X6Q0H7_NEPPI|nr:hypothetical protein NPIL_459731 [Nephila pilipes]
MFSLPHRYLDVPFGVIIPIAVKHYRCSCDYPSPQIVLFLTQHQDPKSDELHQLDRAEALFFSSCARTIKFPSSGYPIILDVHGFAVKGEY